MADRFDKFTEHARRVLTLAQEEAQRFNHNYMGTEHLLLGLVREGDGVAAEVLANLGVRLDAIRSGVEFIIGRGDRAVLGEIGLTPRAKKVIELAVDEARRLDHHYIGTEHLLLGLAREGEGIAAGVLESLGVSLDRIRTETTRILSQSAPPSQDRPPRRMQPEGNIAPPVLVPALRDLVRVVPVAQVQQHNGIEVTVLSLELYVDGFLANLRLVVEPPLQTRGDLVLSVVQMHADDGQWHHYAGRPYGGSGRGPQWRFAYVFEPTLAAAARALRLEVAELHWRPAGQMGENEVVSGPWTFTISLEQGMNG